MRIFKWLHDRSVCMAISWFYKLATIYSSFVIYVDNATKFYLLLYQETSEVLRSVIFH